MPRKIKKYKLSILQLAVQSKVYRIVSIYLIFFILWNISKYVVGMMAMALGKTFLITR